MNKPSDATKKVLMKSKKYIALRLFTSIVYRAIAMITPILFSNAVRFVTDGEYKKAIIMSVVAILTAILFRVFDILSTYSWHKLYNSMYDNYTKIGINKVYDNSLHSLSRFNIGEFLNIMSTDINVMADFYCNLILRVIRVIEVLIIFVYFFMIDLYMGISGIIMAIVGITIMLLSSKKIEKLNQVKSINFDKRNTIINELLLSIREIKAFNIFDSIKNRIQNSTSVYTKSFLRQRVGEDIFKFSILAFIEVCRWGMFIYGIYLITIGKMEIGSLLIVYNYFTQLVEGFSEFTTINIGIRQLKVSENRFFQLIIYSHDKLLLEKKYNFNNLDIIFSNVVYGDKEKPRLNDVSFKLDSNSINVIGGIGNSSKGVVDLLLKLNSQHTGDITIDGISIKDIDFEYYFSLISSIDIEDKFLSVSIKDNLLLINDNLEKVIDICKKLGIHDEISKLKYGYDTILNSSDDVLKQNTKIMLNIARIILKDTRIMIFDNILSSLNPESRKIMFDGFNNIKNDHTIIIIDNKENIIKEADNIVLLSEDKVIDYGSYDKVSKNKEFVSIIES